MKTDFGSKKERYVFIASLIILVITAFFSTGYYHYDEHFQILEFAGVKLNMTSPAEMPWEYKFHARSAIQPVIVVILYKTVSVFGLSNPLFITFLLRLFSALISFTGMFLIYKAYSGDILDDTLKKWYLFLSFFLWFMIFNGVRFSSENWSGSIFILAFALLIIRPNSKKIFYLYIGMLLGLSFLFRYQIGLLILGLFFWHIFIQKNITTVFLMLAGVILIFGFGIIVDRWFYGEWTLSAWNYFNYDILLSNETVFESSPWWYYFERVFSKAIPPFSIVLIIGFILLFIFRWRDILTWTILPFLIVHFIIGHKEIRFLFPIIGFTPIIVIKSVQLIQEKWDNCLLDHKVVKVIAVLFLIVNIVVLIIVAFKPANNQISLYNKIYSDYKTKTSLYYTNENPYHRFFDLNFYKRKELEIIRIDSLENILPVTNKKQLFVTKNKNLGNNADMRMNLIYSTLPEWVEKFNFNHWLEGTTQWYLYELN